MTVEDHTKEQLDSDTVAYRLTIARREIRYHIDILSAVEEGFDDVMAMYGDDMQDPEARRHVNEWARRLAQSYASIAECSGGGYREAAMLHELTTTPEISEPDLN